MDNQLVLVLDFGGQYKELIARRVRECGVKSLIIPGNTPLSEIKKMAPIGLILTGGPNSVYDPSSPRCQPELFAMGAPVLGICYGAQLMAHTLGGQVSSCEKSEYGPTPMTCGADSLLFAGLDAAQTGLMSHTDRITAPPEGFRTSAFTESCPVAAMEAPERGLYAVQFHPEVENTPNGTKMIRNFLYLVCRAAGDYSITGCEAEAIGAVRRQVGNGRVVLGLSGGVDSSVCAALLARAIPGRVCCIFVDHGLLRENEGDQVEAAFKNSDLQFIRVNAAGRFLGKLAGVTEPEKKRRVIGEEFIRVFEEESAKIGADFLAQGTIYPDVIESGANNSANIKSHHNVGGLPGDMAFKGIVEPLRGLFKDEVRALGRALGLPAELVERQPFPGPGLAVRCMGEVTEGKLAILRRADAIFRETMASHGASADQFFAVLTDTRSVGVIGDFRNYGYVVALRAVYTTDFMTCLYAPLDHALLGEAAGRITNELRPVSRVVYDITNKPPATIEWE